jgi:hypothetical protein
MNLKGEEVKRESARGDTIKKVSWRGKTRREGDERRRKTGR